jgi:hypothetical protein
MKKLDINLNNWFYAFNMPLMYFSQKIYIKPYKYIHNIDNKYLW